MTSDFANEHAAWHETVEAARTAPHGPLSATALHWLTDEPTAFDGVPGQWSVDDTGLVTADVAASDGVTLDGAVLDGAVPIGPITGGASVTLEWGNVRLELASRAGTVVLRPRDPQSPTLTGYAGTETFPPDERWVLTGRFAPNERDQVEVDSAVKGASQFYDSPGVAELSLDGEPFKLTLFTGASPNDFSVFFADATGQDLTYPAARSVKAKLADDGSITIDFNRATNFPCAYTSAATCPFPPPENRLPLRIEAGELRPGVSLRA